MIFVEQFFTFFTVFILAIFVGFEVISKVPTTLHTPLMSATNAIHGVVVVGAIVVVSSMFGQSLTGPVFLILGIAAVTLGTINVVGGFAVTERMLQMFKKREPAKK